VFWQSLGCGFAGGARGVAMGPVLNDNLVRRLLVTLRDMLMRD
jgi:hypothetical protein